MRYVCGQVVMRVGSAWLRPSSNEEERFQIESTLRLEIMMMMLLLLLLLLAFMLIQ